MEVPWTWGCPLSLQVRLRHRDHHIFNISKARLSEGQQHKAKHKATSKAQSSLDHAIVLHAWCSWQLSTWHLAWCPRCRGSSGALSHEDQMHGRHAQAAGHEQRGVAGHFSKTRGKPHSLRCLQKTGAKKLQCMHLFFTTLSVCHTSWWASNLETFWIQETNLPGPSSNKIASNKGDLSELPTFDRHFLPGFSSLLLHCRICRIFCLTFLGLLTLLERPQSRCACTTALRHVRVCLPRGYSTMCNQTANKPENRHFLVVDLSATPLLRNGLIHVEDVRGHVVQVLTTKIDPAASTFLHSFFEQQPVTASYSFLLYLDAWYWRIIWYCDIHCDPFLSFKEICPHCPSCCFMERIFGQMSPPLMDGWTSEMSCETVQSWENTFLKVARWSR